ncbi:MAG: DNA cytosine methyltransferase [Firmicutes bacterium]|nr:DNA cytosine methyltransferase [Bacillota bacterium]
MLINRPLRLATVFSGIGAIEHALSKQRIDYEIVFACDNGEITLENDTQQIHKFIKNFTYDEKKAYVSKLYNLSKKTNHVKKTYFDNYKITEEQWHEDIRYIDGTKYEGIVDLFVGGSPCQSFSVIGKKGGLLDIRGSLFYDFVRLIKQIKPKVFIYENVAGMLSHDKNNTWKIISDLFETSGYKTQSFLLNAKDYGIPQNRKRVYVIGFLDHNVVMKEPEKVKDRPLSKEFLDKGKIPAHYYLGRKGFEFVTNPKYIRRAHVDPLIFQTQKANQQFNWNGDFIFEPLCKVKDRIDVLNRAYVGEWNGKSGVIRQLTHRECYRLMGFDNSFIYSNSNIQAYKQAGNSIVVNVLEKIIIEIMKVVNFDD